MIDDSVNLVLVFMIRTSGLFGAPTDDVVSKMQA